MSTADRRRCDWSGCWQLQPSQHQTSAEHASLQASSDWPV